MATAFFLNLPTSSGLSKKLILPVSSGRIISGFRVTDKHLQEVKISYSKRASGVLFLMRFVKRILSFISREPKSSSFVYHSAEFVVLNPSTSKFIRVK